MKTISVAVSEDTHRRLRIMAAEQGTSVSAMIRDHMISVLDSVSQATPTESKSEKHRRELMELADEFQRRGIGIFMSENQTREEMYQRNAPR